MRLLFPDIGRRGLKRRWEQRPAALPIQYANRHLFVGNLPFNCQWQDLKDLFRNAGNILRADVAMGPDGRSRGFGTVLFATPEDAQNALRMYNGYDYNGRQLKVHFDKFAQPGAPGAASPPVVGPPGNGGVGIGYGGASHLQMGRTPSSQSQPYIHHHQPPPSLDTRSVSSASPLPSPFSAQAPPESYLVVERVPSQQTTFSRPEDPLPSPFLPGQHPQHDKQAQRAPQDTWSFLGEHRIDEPQGAVPSSGTSAREVSPSRGGPGTSVGEEREEGEANIAPVARNGSKSTGQRPTSIAMPPPYPLNSGPISPPTGKGMALMTPSMPAFSFQPFPQTPPLMPAQFFSPGLGGLAHFSPPIQSPGWAPGGPGATQGLQSPIPPGYNPMFPPSTSYDPTPGANPHAALSSPAEGLGIGHPPASSTTEIGKRAAEPNGVLHPQSLGAAMEQLSLESQPLRRDGSGVSSHSSSGVHDPRVVGGGSVAGGGDRLSPQAAAIRRASFFGAPGAEKLLHGGKDRLGATAAEDAMLSARRASFDSAAVGLLPRRGQPLLGTRGLSDSGPEGRQADSR